MVDFTKIKALADKAAATGKNMNEAQQGGGGDYEPPAAGPTRLRFISYVELGKQEDTYMGKPRVRDTAMLTFELSGPKHKPTDIDGVKHPHRISIELPISLNEKAHFYKLFRALNHAGKATHIEVSQREHHIQITLYVEGPVTALAHFSQNHFSRITTRIDQHHTLQVTATGAQHAQKLEHTQTGQRTGGTT